jgi:hypothetical protein
MWEKQIATSTYLRYATGDTQCMSIGNVCLFMIDHLITSVINVNVITSFRGGLNKISLITISKLSATALIETLAEGMTVLIFPTQSLLPLAVTAYVTSKPWSRRL